MSIGCAKPEKSKIYVPIDQGEIVQISLDGLLELAEQNPDDEVAVQSCLYYCTLAEWPLSCQNLLEQQKNQKSLDQTLLLQFISFFNQHSRHSELVKMVNAQQERWVLPMKHRKMLILSLLALDSGSLARSELNLMLKEENSHENHEFAGLQFLKLGDSIRAIYHLNKTFKADPARGSMLMYGQLLLNLGYEERGVNVLESYFEAKNEEPQAQVNQLALKIGTIYEYYGMYGRAREKIAGSNQTEDRYKLAHLYYLDDLLDSALVSLNLVLEIDSGNFQAVSLKAKIFEDKGMLSSSLKWYQAALILDPSDSIIMTRVTDLRRKMAYLQRKKFEEQKTLLLQLESKKIENE